MILPSFRQSLVRPGAVVRQVQVWALDQIYITWFLSRWIIFPSTPAWMPPPENCRHASMSFIDVVFGPHLHVSAIQLVDMAWLSSIFFAFPRESLEPEAKGPAASPISQMKPIILPRQWRAGVGRLNFSCWPIVYDAWSIGSGPQKRDQENQKSGFGPSLVIRDPSPPIPMMGLPAEMEIKTSHILGESHLQGEQG